MNKPFWYVLISVMAVLACSVESREIPTLEVGQNFVNSNVRLIVLDTFDLELSTFRFDSINSSDSDRLLFGKYTEDYFGEVEAQSYFELVAAVVESVNGPFEIDPEAELDSVALILGYDGYFYQDTTASLQINVHRLTEDVVPEGDFFFNTSTLDFDSVPILSRNFRPEPFDEDSLHLSLPLTFGQEIFDQITEDAISNNDDLREVFPGLALIPGADDNGSVIGFSRNQENTYLRFYYQVPDEFDDNEETLDLVINPFPNTPVAFHNVRATPEGPLSSLSDQEIELKSHDSDDLAFIQSGTGFALKATFPNIKSIYNISGTGTVLSAILQIRPLKASVTDFTPLRDTLVTSILDANNVIIEEIRTANGLVEGVLIGENEEFDTATYEIPIGIFLDEKLNERPETETALVLFNEQYNETVNRLVLQGEAHEDFRARIIITYAIYEE
ncbi:DUF4270 family protein [Flagellimonas sp. DF-77]|uniref:DUF4270 family protein n=1 Tax=Flagellimonas algarum TaxID=3230298 RepID=UPI0033935626